MRKLYFLFLATLIATVSYGQTTLLLEEFNDQAKFTLPAVGFFSDGVSDYFGLYDPAGLTDDFGTGARPTGLSAVTGFTGNFLAGEDLDDGGTKDPVQIITWNSIDITDYTVLTFSGNFASSGVASYDGTDYILVEASIDGGPFVKVLAIESAGTNTDFSVDADFDGVGDGVIVLSQAAQIISANIPGYGTSLVLKMTTKVDAGSEEIYMDDFKVVGNKNTMLTFATATNSVTEDVTTVDVCVNIVNPDATNATTVEVAFDPGSTATNGSDFSAITFPQTLTFPAGDNTSKCITFTITDDTDLEIEEHIILNLQNPAGGNGAFIGDIAQHTLTIENSDVPCPNVGDLIISEIMQNPAAVADATGEWFEVHNTTASDIDMHGMSIIDDDHTLAEEGFSIPSTLVIPAGGYLLFANNADPLQNGNLPTPDYIYDPSLTLGNGADGLRIVCMGTNIDVVEWDGGIKFPDPSGASMTLNPDLLNSTDNDNGANWCQGKTAYGDGDLGTPGAANDLCCELIMAAPVTACATSTAAADKYSVTIDFTGGNTGVTYTITASAGIVGGDDPSGVASGSIVVSDIPEGTDVTIDLAGGNCVYTNTVSSPYCIPTFTKGDIIITEIMQNPNVVADTDGEYFEVYNTTTADIDLYGWTISDHNSTSPEIWKNVIVPAGGYAVLGINADQATNGGIPVDYEYGGGGIGLDNGSGKIILMAGGVMIDSVAWDNGATFPDPSGKSMSLNNTIFDDTANDDGANWCEAKSRIGEQYGTPGEVNDSCAPCNLTLGTLNSSCDDITPNPDTYTATVDFTGGTGETYTITTTAGTVGGDDPSTVASGTISITGITEGTDITVTIKGGGCVLYADFVSPNCAPAVCAPVGSVIFTEIMQNPNAVADAEGEWFEVHNTTSSDIDLENWAIVDDDHTLAEEGFTITGSLVIPAGGYLVFANNGDPLTNGGITPDYVYDYARLTLGNGADGITIQCSGDIIDMVVWDGGPVFPDPTGASMNLNPDLLNGTDNDDGANWCEGTSTYGDGDFGTPGAANDTCIPCDLAITTYNTSCDAATANPDTYTATIAFTGGGTTTYTVNASVGTVGGDDPSAVAEGTITITGITEGDDLVVDINGGTCRYQLDIPSAVCVTPVCDDSGTIIISEIMQNPDKVADSAGEWFELHNTTLADIDIMGWDIIDDNHTLAEEGFTISGSLVIPGGGYLLFANNGDNTTNGGINPDYTYDPRLTLGNGADGLQIQCNNTLVDKVVWDDGLTFPDPTGASMSLNPAKYSALENDLGENWTAATTAYGDGDFGTPGEKNEEIVLAVTIDEIEGFSVYPNPVENGRIELVTSSTQDKLVRLYNTQGELVYEHQLSGNKEELNLGSLKAGVYMLILVEGDKTDRQKLVIK